jgi:hypothetical protein
MVLPVRSFINIQYSKLLFYYSKGNFAEVLNIVYDYKNQIQLLNKKIDDLILDSFEAICLYRLNYFDSFMTCIDLILQYDDARFINLTDKKDELISIALLMAVVHLIDSDENDINLLSDKTKNKINEINTKFNLIQSNSELVALINNALNNMMIKNTKQDMDNMNKTIKDIFDTYLNRLYSYMYQYQFDTGDN